MCGLHARPIGKRAKRILPIAVVPRHLAMSIGFVFSNPDAISEMIKDEQIISQGLSICEFPW
ncbi:MAG: hypothetical protein U9P73_10550, partial [Candidatus Cloacimonadota bacterium]|nr:hypothetical protein [Candidatus Cloacimonadota bacterium]